MQKKNNKFYIDFVLSDVKLQQATLQLIRERTVFRM